MRPRTLEWHYRSRDERLIAFSNAYIYEGTLTTFPGISKHECINHVLVPAETGRLGQEESTDAEVKEVLELVFDHARRRPNESLGVIAMGIKHANRIEEMLRQSRSRLPELDPFFAEDREERFFIKNLERVQGDERDAIILTVGYGKDASGRLRYHFGP